MSIQRILLLVVASLLALSSVEAATNAQKLSTYTQWHDACLQGGVREIDAEIAKFEGRLQADPSDSLARAFLGSACALRAREGKWGPTKLKYLKRGKAYMEEAVKASPKEARVRMVRAIAYYRIPKRFGVRQTSLNDFKVLLPLAKNAKSGLTKSERQVLLYYGHLAHKEEGIAGADKLKKLAHSLDPSSSYGQLTR